MLLSIEIMLNAVNLTFVAVGRYLGSVDGQIITFFVMTVAAAEAAVGLALVIALFRHRETLNPDALPVEMVMPRCLLTHPAVLSRSSAFSSTPALGRRLPKSVSGGIACLAIIGVVRRLGAVVLELAAGADGFAPRADASSRWITSGDLNIPLTFRLDPLSSLMILVITGIGSLIHIYSTGYMHERATANTRATSRT